MILSSRTCVVTKKKRNRDNLIRITKTSDDVWVLNLDNKIQGRSFYITRDESVIDKFLNLKNFKFIRFFKMNLKLKEELHEYAQNLQFNSTGI